MHRVCSNYAPVVPPLGLKYFTNIKQIYKVSEYDQEIPQSQTAPQLTAREEEPQDTKQIPTQILHKQWEIHKTINKQKQNHRLSMDSSLNYREGGA